MSAEVVTVVAKSAGLLARLKNVASAHPAAAAVVGTVVAGAAVYGTYKAAKWAFGEEAKKETKTEKKEETTAS